MLNILHNCSRIKKKNNSTTFSSGRRGERQLLGTQELLNNFIEKYEVPLHNEAQLALEKTLEKRYGEITSGIVAIFREMFDKIKSAQEAGKGPIAFVYFNLLRTGCLLGSSGCLLCAYDNNWYLDQAPVEVEYDASFLFRPFYEYTEKLYRGRKMYVGRVTRSDVEKILVERWSVYMSYMLLMLRNSINEIVSLPNYDFQKAKQFSINGGEYMDYSDILWIEDREEKDPVSVKALLGHENKKAARHLHLHGIDLSGGDYSENDLRSSRFERVSFNKCVMGACMLMDTIFKECDLRQANLIASHIWYADFSGSNLERANLSYANLYCQPDYEKMKKPYIPKTRFRSANLAHADLSHGNFAMADFSGAQLFGCNLSEAQLHGCDFSRAQLSGCDFSRAQLLGTKIDRKFMDRIALTDAQQGAVQWA